ncbi:Stk1 family PASTA domain-containing Ser/Thr kinase [Paramaledivibacter caminithermalis]|uniref:non-specific serine/threonine protein kinase n=1 Tax=Paramaledivibacter caminithermalis (strain DSM 15212 / CIP 107654 / DViRD3) TaxID=1121301 RepID=A0A1M6NHV5_PARC5|nr:Stk1 family PASTA domain-containing Ser/Thr kinase [Paramaledivibacter caminithermalis]SHJ95216.1 serine/threonine protein kinase [Paramaledivibacter caminithermalis DSM 15212]
MIGKILGKRYEIIEKIGGGGMALVYKAKCHLLNRFVAVKILRPEFISDEDFINKFEKESQAAASLSHPNIVNIYDVGTDNDIHYIVMEYVNGKTLKKYIKEKGFLKNDEFINISKQIALALQHAHNNHIVHRDIKPHNILITEDGRVKVTDFGIARAITSSTITNTGNVIGSVHYFSPEQARGGFVDEKSDIYSLGVTMYEMITGRVPFSGSTPITVALKHLKEEVLPPSMINVDISNGVENIILKCLKKDKNKRYDNANEVYNDLDKSQKDPDHSIDFIDDDESPTRIMPAINDIEDIEDYEKEEKKTSKLTITIGILSALIVSIIFVSAIFLNFFKDKFIIKEVQIPDLTNQSQEIAKNKLNDLGLKVMVEKQLYDDKIPKGFIISQNPAAGKSVKEGYTVRVVVSKGERTVYVPEIIHKEIDEARVELDNNDLILGNIEYEYNDLPIGIIIQQEPKAGTEIKEGASVNIIVSQGREIKTFLMPNMVGKNIKDAKETAKDLGIILKNINYEFSDEYEKDLVISQNISPGTEIKENSVFNVVVSKGPEKIEQPPEEQELPLVMNDFIIPLNFDKEQEVVKVIKTENGVSTTVHEKIHDKSEEKLRLTISGRGLVKIDIYFGEDLKYSKEMLFE